MLEPRKERFTLGRNQGRLHGGREQISGELTRVFQRNEALSSVNQSH